MNEHEQKEIRALYRDALYIVTVPGQDFAIAVFDKTEEGHHLRDQAMDAFTRRHGIPLDLQDSVDLTSYNELLTEDWTHEANKYINKETYPTFRLPLTKEEKGIASALPELPVILDMAHHAAGAKHIPKNNMGEDEAKARFLNKPRKLSDKQKEEQPAEKQEPAPVYATIRHLEADGLNFENEIKEALLRREQEMQIGEKFEKRKIEEHERSGKPDQTPVAFDHINEHLPSVGDGFVGTDENNKPVNTLEVIDPSVNGKLAKKVAAKEPKRMN